MSEHQAIISWSRNNADFLKGKYSREHTWSFDGGATVAASASPANVPGPYANAACVDPEEAFVASISSCHMLWFLFLASKQGFDVESYRDAAVGAMTKNENGISWISSVTLNPKIVYTGAKRPSQADEQQLHHLAHEQCFIANSIKTQVSVRSA